MAEYFSECERRGYDFYILRNKSKKIVHTAYGRMKGKHKGKNLMNNIAKIKPNITCDN